MNSVDLKQSFLGQAEVSLRLLWLKVFNLADSFVLVGVFRLLRSQLLLMPINNLRSFMFMVCLLLMVLLNSDWGKYGSWTMEPTSQGVLVFVFKWITFVGYSFQIVEMLFLFIYSYVIFLSTFICFHENIFSIFSCIIQ